LTTLNATTTVIADGSGAAITLGALDGANALTLTANAAADDGNIILNNADIRALTINDANDVTFSGNFVTSQNVSVSTTATILGTITVNGSIDAGGSVTLANTDATGIDINGPVSGDGGVTMTAATGNVAIDANVTSADNNGITLTATAGNVNIATTTYSSLQLTPASAETYVLTGNLTTTNAMTTKVEPHLAESWSVSEDGLTWTFFLRKDVLWQDGTMLAQQDPRSTPYAVQDQFFACGPLS